MESSSKFSRSSLKSFLQEKYLFMFLITGSLCFVFFSGEATEESETHYVAVPQIRLDGPLSQTVYLNGHYDEPGAEIMEVVNGELRCSGVFVPASGYLDMQVPGTYLLSYRAVDARGDSLPILTRTVTVAENSVAFLNGVYNVAFTCTASTGKGSPVVSKENYIATVTPGSKDQHFILNTVKLGQVDLSPMTVLHKNLIEVIYCHQDVDAARSYASGTLSATRKTFTIEGVSVKNFPYESYRYTNVFTKSEAHP